MATDKPRFSVTFTDDSFRKIQKYKEENNISTQSKAVAQLVEIAINAIELEDKKEKPPALGGELTPERQEAWNLISQMNDKDFKKFMKMAKTMLEE